jgi:hypothetical protein
MINSNVKFSGEPSIEALSSGLATLGRYGDSYMVHAAEGETVIPKEVLEANPDLKEELFSQMRFIGIDDPNRYVVGSALNSINPITGQPEFFFRKIKKAVKKAYKAVKKAFKKALPIVAPIIGNIIAPGIGGLFASGLVTKMQGGSWTDALKSAGMSYLGGVATSGIMGGLSSPGNFVGGFTSGLQSGAMQPFNAAKGLFASGADNTFSQGIFGGLGSNDGIMSGQYFKNIQNADGFVDTTGKILAPQYNPNAAAQIDAINQAKFGTKQSDLSISLDEPVLNSDNVVADADQSVFSADKASASSLGLRPNNSTKLLTPQQQYEAMVEAMEFGNTPGYYNTPQVVPSQVVPSQVVPSQVDPNALTIEVGPLNSASAPSVNGGFNLGKDVAKTFKAGEPGMFNSFGDFANSKIGSSAIVGALGAGISYALTPEKPDLTEEEYLALASPQRSAYNEFTLGRASNPDFAQTPEGQALLAKAGITATRTASQLARSTGTTLEQAKDFQRRRYGMVKQAPGITSLASASQMPENELAAPIGMTMAANGGEIIGPGTGRSDSIPARLSDGEFVMTAQAVRNAGNGNRELGAARMYDMMNKFERAV